MPPSSIYSLCQAATWAHSLATENSARHVQGDGDCWGGGGSLTTTRCAPMGIYLEQVVSRRRGRGRAATRGTRFRQFLCRDKMFACPAGADEEIILWSRSATCWNANRTVRSAQRERDRERERESQKSLKNVVRPGQVAVPAAPPPPASPCGAYTVCALMKRSLIICRLTAANCSYALLHAGRA